MINHFFPSGSSICVKEFAYGSPKYQQPWNIKIPEELKERIYDIDKYREYEHNRQKHEVRK